MHVYKGVKHIIQFKIPTACVTCTYEPMQLVSGASTIIYKINTETKLHTMELYWTLTLLTKRSSEH